MKLLCARAILVTAFMCVAAALGDTVAYWPLAYESGVRSTTSDKFVDSVGGLEAVPSSRLGAAWIEGSDYCPVGTNAFPAAFGVYDPVGGTNVPAVTALYFHKESLDGNAGALRVADPAPLRLTTFTVECFVRMQPGVDPTE